jgi:uncharacterized protein
MADLCFSDIPAAIKAPGVLMLYGRLGGMKEKQEKLQQILASLENALVAYSGGVDSTLLLKLAHDLLGDRAAAAIVISPTLPESELTQARETARALGAELLEFESQEMTLPEFRSNSERRCYFCKNYRYRMLREYASVNDWSQLLDGGNADDLDDFRPGQQAAREWNVRSPLQEAALTKEEIRSWAHDLGLPNWDKPSSACLASRIPYGTEITMEMLSQVGKAEDLLRNLGFREFRVRHHGDIARIEVPPADFNRLLEQRLQIVEAIKKIGFSYITLDISGFRSGSLNERLAIYG